MIRLCSNNLRNPKHLFRLAKDNPKNIWKSRAQKRSLKNFMTQAFMKIVSTKQFIKSKKKINKIHLPINLNCQPEPKELLSITLNWKREWKFTASRNHSIIVHLPIFHRVKAKVSKRFLVKINFPSQLRFLVPIKNKRKGSEKCSIESKQNLCKRLTSIRILKLLELEDTILKFSSLSLILLMMTVFLI